MATSPFPLSWASLAVAAALAPALRAEPAAAPPPNIIFILADDLGYGDLGCYGQREIQTPNIDRLAREGMRFTQFYAGAPVCAPSRTVLMTGKNTGHATIRGNAKVNLKPSDVTVAEVLRRGGYATGLSGKWGLGTEGSEGSPLHKGFDHFFGYVDQTMAHNYYPAFLVRDGRRVPLRNVVPHPGRYGQGVATVRLDYAPDLIAADAYDFIERNRDRPFFLYLSQILPHANDERKPDGMEVPDYGPYARRDWPGPEKGYAAMVTRLDDEVGRVMAELKRLGLEDRTLVIFTSDNGPHHEGGYDPAFFHSAGRLRGLKRDVYEGGIREPMIARWPGHIAAGSETDQVGYFGDFLATAAELARQETPPGLDSISLVPTLLGHPAAQEQHRFLYWEFYEGESSQAVRMGNWKAVRIPMLTGPIQLYDLARDPGETHDVAAEHPGVVARARAVMEREHVPDPAWKVGAAANPN